MSLYNTDDSLSSMFPPFTDFHHEETELSPESKGLWDGK